MEDRALARKSSKTSNENRLIRGGCFKTPLTPSLELSLIFVPQSVWIERPSCFSGSSESFVKNVLRRRTLYPAELRKPVNQSDIYCIISSPFVANQFSVASIYSCVPGSDQAVLPERITSVLEKAIPELGQKMRGFDDSEAVLTAPETRSSSPVRILRGKDRVSLGLRGLYPCGEGAGYAGGISSAAVDGMRCAEALIGNLQNL